MTYDKFLKAAPVVFLIGTMVTAILYQKTLLEIWLTIAITLEPLLIILSCDGWLHLSTIPSCITEQITENVGIR